ncbi:MAG: hypothetical protein JXX28_13715 [Deltaproteobacteria bacterium]|nr:hypothetical protein [Deltaproteobacteria bacterium]
MKYTTTSPGGSRGRADVPSWRFAVQIPAARALDLSPADQSLVAALGGLALEGLRAPESSGLPIVLGVYRSRDEAAALAQRAAQVGAQVTRGGAGVGLLIGLTVVALSTLTVLGGAVALALGLIPWLSAAVALLATLAAIGGGAVSARSVARSRALQRATDHCASWRMDGPTWELLFQARAQIASLDLAEAVSSDLRGTLREVEEQLLRAPGGEVPELSQALEQLMASLREGVAASPAADTARRLRERAALAAAAHAGGVAR